MSKIVKTARALATAALLALTLLTTTAGAQRYGSEAASRVDGWMKFEPKGELFSIRMPTPPKLTVRKGRVTKGRAVFQITAREYAAQGPKSFGGRNGEVYYFVSSVELPGATPKGDGVVVKREEFDKIMYMAQQEFEQGLREHVADASLDSPREVFSGLHKGREYAIRLGPGAARGQVRFFPTATHAYIVAYVGFSYYGVSFLDSLELKNDNRLIIK
jgi:hypothetical protein